MKKISSLLLGMIGITAALLTTSCNNQSQEEVSPVDLSDVIETYEWYIKTPESLERDSILYTKITSGYPHREDEFGIIRAKEFTGSLTPFEDSYYPLLNKADDMYRACLMVHGITSNMELWMRLNLAEQEDSIPCEMTDEIKKFNTNTIKDSVLRNSTELFKQQVIQLTSADQMTAIEIDSLMNNYTDTIYERIIEKLIKLTGKIHADEEANTAFQEEFDTLTKAGENALANYNKADSASQLKVILTDLNNCKTLDEQCSLWMAWARSGKSRDEVAWHNYVAYKLLTSRKYSCFMLPIWMVWRAETQILYYGLSSYSYIPNEFYNRIRTQCFVSTLWQLQDHPTDLLTLESAYCFSAETNLSRFGSFTGNEALLMLGEYLPAHYNDNVNDNDNISQ